jgi:hypothetical protein
MNFAPEELVAAARDGWLANPKLPVPRRDPLVLPHFDNTPDSGGVGIMREVNRVSQPSEVSISSFDKRTGTVAALAAGLDPAEKEHVWNIGVLQHIISAPVYVETIACRLHHSVML